MEREQIDIQMSELETRLERLRALYEQYFLGIERIEPGVPRKDVERRVAELRRVRFQSTAQRFKFQTIVQRYNTMQQHWSRICREIENGTYRRHKLKAERAFAAKEAEEQKPPQKEAEPERLKRSADARKAAEDDLKAMLDSDLDMTAAMQDALRGLEEIPDSLAPPARRSGGSLLSKLSQSASAGQALNRGLAASLPPQLSLRGQQEGRQQPPANPTPSGKPAKDRMPSKAAARSPASKVRGAGAGSGGRQEAERLSEDRVRALHRAYVEARQRTNARTVSYEKMERSLRETEAKLRETHKGKRVDFDVLVKNGKAILKPRLG